MRSIAGLLLAGGMLMLFGCGGGSSASDSSLSRAEFTKKVNELCKQEEIRRVKAKEVKQDELGLAPGQVANPKQHMEIVETSLPPYERMTEQIEELAPSEQADELEPLIEAREEVAEVIRQAQPLEPSLKAIKQANDRALEQGLEECSI